MEFDRLWCLSKMIFQVWCLSKRPSFSFELSGGLLSEQDDQRLSPVATTTGSTSSRTAPSEVDRV